MTDEKRNDDQSLSDKLIAVLLGLPWPAVLGDLWKIIRKVMQGWSYKGMYEVLDYESTLELRDRTGKSATFKKREEVRYLQDNVVAYQDQAWGEGEILANCRHMRYTAKAREPCNSIMGILGNVAVESLT